MKLPSRRMQQVQTPMIPVVGEWIAKHPGTISLGQGIVHYSPPPGIREAVAAAIATEPRIDRYCLVRGIAEFLDEIEKKVTTENRIDLSQKTTVVTTAGSNMGFQNTVLAIADVDDEIILLTPHYFNHEMAIDIAGCKTVLVPTDSQYQIDLAAMESAITPRTRAVVTVSPSNPTGAVYSQASLEAVNALCKRKQIYHVSDEAYEYFLYGESHFSPGSIPDSSEHTISLFSLSKAYGMAGWRTAYMVIPNHLESAVKKIQDTNLVCPPVVNQLAAAAALRVGKPWCEEQIAGFQDVRDLVLAEFDSLGDRCEVPRPNGAFYVLAKLRTDKSDMELVESLIRDFGIAVMPGQTFGVMPTDEGCSIRIAYGALDRQTVTEGMGRLVRGLTSLL